MVGNADKRQHILDVATRLAATDGLRGLSVRSVAAAAGIGATTLRAYFPSQALLYRAVAGRIVSHVLSDEWIQDVSLAPRIACIRACGSSSPARRTGISPS
ncbi:hypothetical protein CGL27_08530 [Streptomyces sp. 11-1-2]|nr:hypothetical protein CGL27_08530 [Streptomyces sp. 11-1-2]